MKFSVITVALNDEKGLQRTGESVAAQTCRDYEWLIMDGGSTDGTAGWLERTSGQPRVAWWSERDRGSYDAMNKGIDRARGDYVVFMNAGDELAEASTLSRVLSELNDETPVDFVYGDAVDIDREGVARYRRARDHTALWWTMFACHQAMFFRRDRIGQLRYELCYRTAADYAFVAQFLHQRLAGGPATVARIDAPLCRFWLGGISWRNRRSTIREDLQIRARHLSVPLYLNLGLFVAHHAHTVLKRGLPRVAQTLRYERPESESRESPNGRV